ncbi:hypothetical protein [Bowmanella dokdonensis]|uniref:Cytochrome c domain-containing protein n=1 Tax=Bowmanella dokdonensis TaxID=751969 RepID=A0A939DML3_9ALTE|nr:hypothetical protein [Bowmanella dokdonensis]MBN7825427.1 hypothetical protein [Bowmanella dokdonensis]
MKRLILLLLLAGCRAGDGTGLDESGQPVADNPPPPDSPQPTLAQLQQQVLTPVCATCHSGANAPLGLRMDSLEQSAANLIGVDSVTDPSLRRVEPGDALASVLYLKLSGDPAVGSRMPLGQAPLSDTALESFRLWIEQGAIVETQASRFFVTTAQTNLVADELRLELTFNTTLDPGSVKEGQVLVWAESGSASRLVNVSHVHLHFPQQNRLRIGIDSQDLGADRLSIQLNHPSVANLVSQQGILLDGDGDHFEGGAFSHVYQF